MAGRIRTIKPELREHAGFAALTDGAARMFLMLYTLVDDAGRCPADPGFLAGAVFFGRPRKPHVVGQLLTELEGAGLVVTYQVNGARFLAIDAWSTKGSVTYQVISHPQPSRYPAPSPSGSMNGSRNVPGSNQDGSPISDHRSPITESESSRARAIPGPAPAPQAPRTGPAVDRSRHAPDPRIRINHAAWAYAASKHAELRGSGIDQNAIPWPAMPVGSGAGDLVARTREVAGDPPDFERAMEIHRRRIDVAVAECRREGHLKWFTPSRIWEERSFWKGAEQSPDQAAQPRIGPRGAEPAPLRLVAPADDAPRFGATAIARLGGKS